MLMLGIYANFEILCQNTKFYAFLFLYRLWGLRAWVAEFLMDQCFQGNWIEIRNQPLKFFNHLFYAAIWSSK